MQMVTPELKDKIDRQITNMKLGDGAFDSFVLCDNVAFGSTAS